MATSFSDYQAERGQTAAPAAAPKQGGGGFLSALPSILAAGASFIPGVGTIGAGLIGGAGEAGRQLLSGEKLDVGKIGGEAALSAIPFGIGRIGKVTKLAKGATEAVETGAKTAKATGPSLTAHLGQKIRASGRDIQAGTKIPGTQDILDEGKAAAINKVISESQKGLVGKTGRGQLTSVQRAIDDQGKVIGDLTKNTKMDIGTDQLTKLGSLRDKYLTKNVANFDPSSKSDIAIVNNFARQVEGAKTLQELETVRRGFDKVAKNILKNPDRTGSLEANIAKSYRDAIDEFTSGINPALKAAKTKYSNLRTAEDLLSKQASPKGLALAGTTFQGKGLGGGLIQSAQETAGKTLESIGSSAALPTFGRSLAAQGLVRGAAAPFSAATPETAALDANGQPIDVAQTGVPADTSMTPDTASLDASLGGTDQASAIQNGLQQAALQALSQGDTKGLENIVKVAGLFESMGVLGAKSAEKPLSAEASKVIANANSGLKSLSQLAGIIEKEGVPKGTIIPGRDIAGGLGASVLGTSKYDTLSRNVADVITRLRTGAAITESEERFYKSQLPQAFDPPETINEKLQMFQDLFSSISNRTGSSGSDIESLLGGTQ